METNMKRIFYSTLISICVLFVGCGKVESSSTQNKDGSNQFNYENEVLDNVAGKWQIVDYLGHSVETTGEELRDVTEEEIKKYIGKCIDVSEGNITAYYAPTELGYFYDTYKDLFFVCRNPSDIDIIPGFMCIEINLKNWDEWIDIISDASGKKIACIEGLFFELEPYDKLITSTTKIITESEENNNGTINYPQIEMIENQSFENQINELIVKWFRGDKI